MNWSEISVPTRARILDLFAADEMKNFLQICDLRIVRTCEQVKGLMIFPTNCVKIPRGIGSRFGKIDFFSEQKIFACNCGKHHSRKMDRPELKHPPI